MNTQLPLRTCVSAYLYTPDGRFLLAEKPRPHHTHQLPQGGVEPDETLPQALIREIHEEINLKITNPTPTNLTHTYPWPPDKQKLRGFRGQTIHFFTCPLPPDQTPTPDQNEIIATHLVTLPQAKKLIEDPHYFQIISQLHAQIHQN